MNASVDPRTWNRHDLGGGLLVVGGLGAVLGFDRLLALVTLLRKASPTVPRSASVPAVAAYAFGGLVVALGVAAIAHDGKRRWDLFLGALLLVPVTFSVLVVDVLVPMFLLEILPRGRLPVSRAVAGVKPLLPVVLVGCLVGVVTAMNALTVERERGQDREWHELDRSQWLAVVATVVVVSLSLSVVSPSGGLLWGYLALAAGAVAAVTYAVVGTLQGGAGGLALGGANAAAVGGIATGSPAVGGGVAVVALAAAGGLLYPQLSGAIE